jgi:Arc/MetJ family transcription regulator
MLVHMKRIHLVLDEQLLAEVMRLSGERTYSAAVARTMSDYVRRAHTGRILELAGCGLWEGDLAAMRDDHPPPRPRRGPRVDPA